MTPEEHRLTTRKAQYRLRYLLSSPHGHVKVVYEGKTAAMKILSEGKPIVGCAGYVRYFSCGKLAAGRQDVLKYR